jgi:hypothetical protein
MVDRQPASGSRSADAHFVVRSDRSPPEIVDDLEAPLDERLASTGRPFPSELGSVRMADQFKNGDRAR